MLHFHKFFGRSKNILYMKGVMHTLDYPYTMIFQLAECNLREFIQKHPQHSQNPRVWKHLAEGIANGLKTLHEVKIAHMDLKPENILLQGVKEFLEKAQQNVIEPSLITPLICDFGASKVVENTVISNA